MLREGSLKEAVVRAALSAIILASRLAFLQYHGNPNQMCFLAKKVEGEELEQLGQYLESRDTVDSIRAKERIYGQNWLSTGGESTTRVRLPVHNLKGFYL